MLGLMSSVTDCPVMKLLWMVLAGVALGGQWGPEDILTVSATLLSHFPSEPWLSVDVNEYHVRALCKLEAGNYS